MLLLMTLPAYQPSIAQQGPLRFPPSGCAFPTYADRRHIGSNLRHLLNCTRAVRDHRALPASLHYIMRADWHDWLELAMRVGRIRDVIL